MICEICNKKVNGITFTLVIKIVKNVLTRYRYGALKDIKEINGHYICLKKYYNEMR